MKNQSNIISPGLTRYMAGDAEGIGSWEPSLSSERQAQLFSFNSNLYHEAKGQLFRLMDLLYPSTETDFKPSKSSKNV